MKRSEQGPPSKRANFAGARVVLGLWLCTALSTLTACLPQTGVMTGACVAGRAEGCDCVGGGRGVQICARDGMSFGACMCGSVTGPMGTCGAASGPCCNGGGCNAGLSCHVGANGTTVCRATACGSVGRPCCFDGATRCEGGECEVNASGSQCVALTTTPTCGPGQAACGSRCVNLSNDPGNCGSCGRGCGAGQTCSGGTCMTSTMPVTGMLGAACTGNASCGGLSCIPDGMGGFPGGYCTGGCTMHEQCGPTGLCVPVDDTRSICFVQCVPNTPCPRSQYACHSVTEDNSLGVCLPDCRLPEQGCSATGVCNMSTGVCDRVTSPPASRLPRTT